MENKSDSATILELSNSVTLLKNKWLEIDSIYDAISKETQRIWWRLEDDLKENQRKWAAKEELYEENQRKWDLFRKSMIEALSNF